jgi:hypothetical protein
MESTPETTTTETNDGQFVPREEAPSQKPATSAMTRSKCIDLIGKAKYDEYTKRYGSETAALRKCTILQRVQR